MVGYYHANALARDTELPTAARRVADALAAAHPGCIVLLVRKTQTRLAGSARDLPMCSRTVLHFVSSQADAQALADRETALPPVAWQVRDHAQSGAREAQQRPDPFLCGAALRP